ncbi:MACPF domain-containing protein CAD1-like [Humulus lupulus]|uniref:MACPF domain-containing protein CAD1-like n=1 Tax=Humulus lupulus TaxID=3486 RepID=UPI002B4184E3|nr:MACPF domain-containing protein CAD1-like [Humulus lupulus]
MVTATETQTGAPGSRRLLQLHEVQTGDLLLLLLLLSNGVVVPIVIQADIDCSQGKRGTEKVPVCNFQEERNLQSAKGN